MTEEVRYVTVGDRAAEALRGDGTLSVIAVHSESVYLRQENGRLLLLHPDRYGSVPFGVGLPDFPDVRERSGAETGQAVTVTNDRLVFPNGYRLFVRQVSDPLFPEKGEKAGTERFGDRAILLAAAYAGENGSRRGLIPALPVLLAVGKPEEDMGVFASVTASMADALADGLLCGDGAALSVCLSRLVGLGYGLTPSGDDFICGMLYALWRAAPERAALLARVLEPLLAQTGEISREYLLCAMENAHFGLVADAMDAMLGCPATEKEDTGEKETLFRALEALFAVGASSGSDILCGMLFALSVIRTML